VNWSAAGPAGPQYLQAVRAAVQPILGAPGTATQAFVQAQREFAAFVAAQTRAAEDAVAKARAALRAAEERESLALDTGAFLYELLAGAPLDPFLLRFLLHDWARVLVEAAQGAAVPGLLPRMLSVVPDLVWSVQPVTGAAEQKRLADVVPALFENLRDGLARIGWSGSRLRELLEHLQREQARALAAGMAGAPGLEVLSVSTVRIRLDGFRLGTPSGPPRLKPFDLVEEAVHRFLAAQDCGVSHRRVQDSLPPSAGAVLEPAQAEQIIERWRPGTWFDLRINRAIVRVRLEAFTPSRSLALFSSPPAAEASAAAAAPHHDPLPAPLYSLSHASLKACVCSGRIQAVEPLPLLARAFRRLLSDLQRSAEAAAEGGSPASASASASAPASPSKPAR
jgi:hypothetical protein